MPNKPNKTDSILKLLRRPNGASMAQLQAATAWQPHSLRAALTGLRKKGHDIERGKDAKGVTVYRIAKSDKAA
jgi:hypothetical protein